MYLDCFDDVRELTKELVRIPSVVKTRGEADCAQRIHAFYRQLQYFRDHPEYLLFKQPEDDEVERYNVLAMVKGTKGDSKRTVILLGHLDTVGVDDFGTLAAHAFDPDTLPKLLRELPLGDEVRGDLHSGEYMFGRGVLDMKSGVAGHMCLMRYFSEHPEELDGNIIAISECDEENNAHGIISALKVLRRWKREHDLQYIAGINGDYSTPYHENDENRYIYFGTIGKLLPAFYAVGKETHVGQAFGGLDPNLLVAELTRRINLNPDLCDQAQGEVTVPPISLKQTDCKDHYTVQTAIAAYAYYNVFTHSMSPKDVMGKMKAIAVGAFDHVVQHTNSSYQRFCQMAGHVYTELPWKPRVYTWEEFYDELIKLHGETFTKHFKDFAADMHRNNPAMDLRDFNVRMVEEAWKWATDKSPAVIVYYASTMYPNLEMTGETEKEKRLMDCVRESVDTLKTYSSKPVVTKMFYPYISDSSFMAISGEQADYASLERNTPAWGVKYRHPYEDIAEINVPMVNIGTYGKDGHKITERVHMRHTFEHIPNITYQAIKRLLD